VRSETLMASAKGQPCAVRLPMVCTFNPAQTVLAHLPGIGKGMSTKGSDIHAAFACAACHDGIDRRVPQPAHLRDSIILDAMLRGLAETQARWVEMGLLTAKDSETI